MADAILTIIDGPDRGRKTTISAFSCRVIGRHLDVDAYQNEQTVIMPKALPLAKNELEHINSLLQSKGPAEGLPAGKSFDQSYKRLPDCIVDDDNVSRLHAMLFYGDGITGIIDLGSTNGTKVNNNKVEIARLRDGDYITVGKTTFIVGETP